jgi:hypothetical protein
MVYSSFRTSRFDMSRVSAAIFAIFAIPEPGLGSIAFSA